jgi:hypothetical protein
VADERFYAALRRYLAATRPPLQAVAAVDFMHGLAAWDFAEAARSADRLSFDASLGEGWVPATMLLDGGVVAKLRTGDVAGARALYDELTPVLGGVGGLRARLIEAHLRVAEAKAR